MICVPMHFMLTHRLRRPPAEGRGLAFKISFVFLLYDTTSGLSVDVSHVHQHCCRVLPCFSAIRLCFIFRYNRSSALSIRNTARGQNKIIDPNSITTVKLIGNRTQRATANRGILVST